MGMFSILIKAINLLISPFLSLLGRISLSDAYTKCVASSVVTIIEMKSDGIHCNLSNIKIYIDRLQKEIFKK